MSIAFVSRDHVKCHGCGVPTLVAMLDAKPFAHATPAQVIAGAERGADFGRLECRTCYGPGWRPMS